jgi:hypothetical protein
MTPKLSMRIGISRKQHLANCGTKFLCTGRLTLTVTMLALQGFPSLVESLSRRSSCSEAGCDAGTVQVCARPYRCYIVHCKQSGKFFVPVHVKKIVRNPVCFLPRLNPQLGSSYMREVGGTYACCSFKLCLAVWPCLAAGLVCTSCVTWKSLGACS